MTTPDPRRLAPLSVLAATLLLVGVTIAAQPASAADGETRWEDLTLKAR